MKIALALLLIIAVSFGDDRSTACKIHNDCNEALIFSDDFDVLNTRTWKHEVTLGGGGNWEFELYVNNRTTSYVKDSVLYLHPRTTASVYGNDITQPGFEINLWGGAPDGCTNNGFYGCQRGTGGGNIVNPITSARINTINSFSFKYGRVEVRAKLPLGDWIWPAIWLLPVDNMYGGWPASGEIDLLESRGNQNYAGIKDGGVEGYSTTLHWGPDWAHNAYDLTHGSYKAPQGLLSDDFHIYGMYWDEERLVTYIDNPNNIVFNTSLSVDFWNNAISKGQKWENLSKPWTKKSPFDQEFYLIMNVAVGGVNGYFPDVGAKPWSNKSPHASAEFWSNRDKWEQTWKGDNVAMKVDSVKVWSTKSTTYTKK
ncbi:beta-1,3-glucan-binding protein [Acrasis kona]|uniref:Beta-1,3-glucan-binding protein n=1 Tax=Acrasis kona TaxID=1008807 RepID=A0AAW2ZDC9_9EUKA